MSYRVKYRHPVTGNVYYFVDYRRSDSGALRPVGCMALHIQKAMIFETERDAMPVAVDLAWNGYRSVKVVKT